jgi:hypothetical protein
MSNMEDLEGQLSEQKRQAEVNARALASIKATRRKSEAQGYAVMSGALGYGEGALGSGTFGKISHGAKLFCILFAMLAPSLLVWGYLL